jgi:hypothetical protein
MNDSGYENVMAGNQKIKKSARMGRSKSQNGRQLEKYS